MSSIPIYLSNRDLVSPIRAMVARFAQAKSAGPITIFDCGSTYPPLLEWYDAQTAAEVVRLENEGHMAPMRRRRHDSEFFFVSDGDFDLDGTPLDFLDHLRDGLIAAPECYKAGLTQRIDDLPAGSPIRDGTIESQLEWLMQPRAAGWYNGKCDTSPAVYQEGRPSRSAYGPAILSAHPYTCRHLSWYLTQDNLTEEWRYFLEHAGQGKSSWSERLRKRFIGPRE